MRSNSISSGFHNNMLQFLSINLSIFVSKVKGYLKTWSQPTTIKIIAGTIADLPRSRSDLMAENALLRQQLIVLKRQVKKPKLNNRDRFRLIFLARLTRFWCSALHIVQPETLLRWHRNLFRIYWRRKTRPKGKSKRTISEETIELIKRMAKENPLWGAEKIRGELLKLGIKLSKRTIQKYMPKIKRKSGQTWSTFLKNHAGDIWACDFTVVHDLLFRPVYVFIIIEMKTRRIVHAAVTTNPTDAWTAQQLREATPWGQNPKYLIRDNDRKYGKLFTAMAQSSGIREIRTPIKAPKANAICERTIGSLKQECLDHMFILHRYQLKRILNEYTAYYNNKRAHQGIEQRIPGRFENGIQFRENRPGRTVNSQPILGGLHHHYSYSTSYQ